MELVGARTVGAGAPGAGYQRIGRGAPAEAEWLSEREEPTVQQHKSQDIPLGTLKSIQRDMTPAFGEGWLLG
ncbi:MAG: hypothetical protein E6Q56_09880 [Mycobacterium sp.]|nr:MAG: hypothetical protein E6Q56_09880 [Mycobacterium sp.]